MKKVITYGTFDLLHVSHINLIRRAKEMGDYLIVGLSTDEFNEMKNKQASQSYENRKIILESIKYIDEVIAERSWEQKIEDIKNYEIDLFVIGDDWEGKFDYLREYCDVVYLPRTIGVSTTQLKSDISKVKNG